MRTTLVRCKVTRQECATFDYTTPYPHTCAAIDPVERTIEGDLCVNELEQGPFFNTCEQNFCTGGIDAPGTCRVVSAQGTAASPECTVQTSGFTRLRDVQLHGVDVAFAFYNENALPGTARNETVGTVDDPPICVPPGDRPLDWARPLGADHSTAVKIGQAIPNAPECTMESDRISFSLTAAPIATASVGGTTAALTALRGQIRIGRSCADGFCDPTTLDDFQADLADVTISNVALRKLRLRSVMPAEITPVNEPDSGMVPGIAAGGLRLRADGLVNGVDSQLVFVNTSPLLLDVTSSTVRLRGSFVLNADPAGGGVLPLRVEVDVRGPLATPEAVACSTQSWLERVFGFEDVQSWSSTQGSLSLVTSPVQQGCGALGVRGQGFMSIAGARFSTRGLLTNAGLSVDLFIPGGQPNPYWTGALQAHLSCPSGGVSNQYVGQVELTGKPVNRYSTLRFPLSSAIRTTLARPLDDCSFTFGLNVNATGNTWILDKLRFTP